jgi:hypothetical protein
VLFSGLALVLVGIFLVQTMRVGRTLAATDAKER